MRLGLFGLPSRCVQPLAQQVLLCAHSLSFSASVRSACRLGVGGTRGVSPNDALGGIHVTRAHPRVAGARRPGRTLVRARRRPLPRVAVRHVPAARLRCRARGGRPPLAGAMHDPLHGDRCALLRVGPQRSVPPMWIARRAGCAGGSPPFSPALARPGGPAMAKVW